MSVHIAEANDFGPANQLSGVLFCCCHPWDDPMKGK